MMAEDLLLAEWARKTGTTFWCGKEQSGQADRCRGGETNTSNLNRTDLLKSLRNKPERNCKSEGACKCSLGSQTVRGDHGWQGFGWTEAQHVGAGGSVPGVLVHVRAMTHKNWPRLPPHPWEESSTWNFQTPATQMIAHWQGKALEKRGNSQHVMMSRTLDVCPCTWSGHEWWTHVRQWRNGHMDGVTGWTVLPMKDILKP